MRNRQIQGFTLIELMVSIAVASILLAVAIPSFSDFIKRSRITSQQDSLYSGLMFARSEAVNRAQNVTVCASSNQTACLTTGSGNVSWAIGWIIFVDQDADGVVDTGDEVLKVQAAVEGGNSVIWNSGRFTSYNSEGRASSFGTFTLCDAGKDLQFARSIIISSSGRVRRDTTNAAGGALVCN